MLAWVLLACAGRDDTTKPHRHVGDDPADTEDTDTDAEPPPPIWIADAYATCEDDGRTKVRVYVDPGGVSFEATLYAIDTGGTSVGSEERMLTPGVGSGGHEATLDFIEDYDTQWGCGTYEERLTLVARVYEIDDAGARTGAMDCLAFGDDPSGLLAGAYDLSPPPTAPTELAACRVLE